MTTLAERDKRSMLHPFTSIAEQQAKGPHIFTEASGIFVRDTEGREYIDGMAGLWCVNVGYGRTEIAEAMAEQVAQLSYYHSFMGAANAPSIELADRMASLAPGDLNKVFFGCTGSDANETQIKLVWQYNNLLGRPQRKKIIARQGAYHGVTLGAVSLSGLPHLHAQFDVPLDRFIHVKKPHHYWHAPEGMSEPAFSAHLAEDLESVILREGPETIAAMIVEPIMGAGGVIVPPEGYFAAIQPVVRKYDILLIADEVICGFGRLGEWFGASRLGIEPDLITCAKGLTSGYVPLSACVVSDRIWEVFRAASAAMGPFGHGFTYTAHPVCAAAALANLSIIEREGLLANALRVGAYFQELLRSRFSDHPLIGEVRGMGLIAGLELVADKRTKRALDLKRGLARRLSEYVRDAGLICRPIYNTVAFAPPLIVTAGDIDEIVERFERGLHKFESSLDRDDLA
jgi:L-2,4-diaminobutyrate transaminase